MHQWCALCECCSNMRWFRRVSEIRPSRSQPERSSRSTTLVWPLTSIPTWELLAISPSFLPREWETRLLVSNRLHTKEHLVKSSEQTMWFHEINTDFPFNCPRSRPWHFPQAAGGGEREKIGLRPRGKYILSFVLWSYTLLFCVTFLWLELWWEYWLFLYW